MSKKKISLKDTRLKHGLTLEELAKASSVPFSTVQAIESGRLLGSLSARMRIAEVLRISFFFLMTDIEQRAVFGEALPEIKRQEAVRATREVMKGR